MLKNKTAVITGGSRGIGAATAEVFMQNGCNVAVIYASNDKAADDVTSKAEQFGVRSQAYKCNVADFDEVSETFKKIYADFQTVDILVNCAGITKDTLVLKMTPDDFESVLDVNLKGTFNTIKQVYRPMMKQRSGKIINLSSVAGTLGNAGQVNYSASKAGVIGLTKSLARELAARGVCVNAVAPGFISTDMTAAFKDNEELKAAIPLKRFGEPQEAAELIAFLASDKANYITGQCIRIDGGMNM